MDPKPSIEKFLAELNEAITEEQRSWLSLRFNLTSHSERIQSAIFAAAMPHWFDIKMLEFMLEFKLSEVEQKIILNLPYIERYGNVSWNVHEKTRSLLRRQLKQTDGTVFRKLSRKAAAWSRKQKSRSASWTIEAVYHAILAEEKGAEASAVDVAIELLQNRRFAQLEAFSQHILEAANAELISGQIVAWTWLFIGDMDIALGRLQEAESAASQIKRFCEENQRLIAESDFLLGLVRLRQGHPHDAAPLFRRAAECFEKVDWRLGQANAISALGTSKAHIGELKSATACYESAKRFYISAEEPYGQANCEFRQGEIGLYNGDLATARKHVAEASRIFKRLSDRNGLANCLMQTGRLAFETANFDSAESQYRQALAIYESLHSELGISNILRELSELKYYLKDYAEADKLVRRALEIAETSGDGLSEANCLRAYGAGCLESGRTVEARRLISEALEIYAGRGYIFGELNCLLQFARLEEEANDFESALQKYLILLGRSESAGVPRIRATVLGQMARYHLNRFDLHRAASLIDLAITAQPEIDLLLTRAEINILTRRFDSVRIDIELAAKINGDFAYLNYIKGKLALWEGSASEAAELFSMSALAWSENGEISLWHAVSEALVDSDFVSSLRHGLSRTYQASNFHKFLYQLKCYRELKKHPSLEIIDDIVKVEFANRDFG